MTMSAMHHKRLLISIISLFILVTVLLADEVNVTGTVSDGTGVPVMNARVSIFLNNREFRAISGTDGRYSVTITGYYSDVAGEFSAGTPYPNPFDNSVNIPFIINTEGDVMLTVYSLAGQKVRVIVFPGVAPGKLQCRMGRLRT